MVMRNISVFCLKRVTLYFKVKLNSIDFYKGIFLHVIPRSYQRKIVAVSFNKTPDLDKNK